MLSLSQKIWRFVGKLKEDHVNVFAAQAAYYIMLSFIPFLMLLLSLIKYTPVTKANLMQFLVDILPTTVTPLVTTIIEDLYIKSATLTLVTAALAIWSAARAILSITAGFNSVYGVKETRNYILLRLRSAVYTLLLLLLIIASLLTLVFGQTLQTFFRENAPVLADITEQVLDIRILGSFLLQTVLFVLLYRLIPNRKGKLLRQLPGAIFSSIGWNLFSYGFSIYIENSSLSYMYGSLTTLVIIMLWLYFCMYIVLVGAGLNATIENSPLMQHWEKKLRRKH